MMNISRRNFIKGGVAGTATLGLSGSLLFADKWLRPATAASDSGERIAYTYHPRAVVADVRINAQCGTASW